MINSPGCLCQDLDLAVAVLMGKINGNILFHLAKQWHPPYVNLNNKIYLSIFSSNIPLLMSPVKIVETIRSTFF